MKLISALYPSLSEVKHTCPVDEALDIVKQHLERGADIDGMEPLRNVLMLPFDSEVMKQVESGEWLLVRDEAYYFDRGQIDKSVGAKLFEHRVMELMNPSPGAKKSYGCIFKVISFDSREPLIERPYIAMVSGKIIEGRTDSEGRVQLLAPSDGVPVSIRVSFRTPLQHTGGLFSESTDTAFVTELMSRELDANTWVCRIAVNDRAMTRHLMIKRAEISGFPITDRSEWGAVKSGKHISYDWDYSMIALHHAGRSYGCGGSGSTKMGRVFSEHLEKFGDIGYHFGIDCSGQIFEGRDIRLKGASVAGYNTKVIGVVLLEDLTNAGEVGDVVDRARGFMEVLGQKTQNTVPAEQMNALTALIGIIRSVFPIEILGGHREFPKQTQEGKVCPGNNGMKIVEALRGTTGLEVP